MGTDMRKNMTQNKSNNGGQTAKPKISAAIIQSREAHSNGGIVPVGGKAANAARVAAIRAKPVQIREAKAHGGVVQKGGQAANAQRRASHAKIFRQK